jgi:hypothetical protein
LFARAFENNQQPVPNWLVFDHHRDENPKLLPALERAPARSFDKDDAGR